MRSEALSSDARQVETVFVILGADCNLRCAYCFQNQKNPRQMDSSTLKRTLDFALRSRQPHLNLVFFGGEPLLYYDRLQEGVDYILSNKPPDKTVQFDISTNGLLLRDGVVAFLVEHDFALQISFDGAKAAQNLRGHGTFDRLDAALTRLQRQHPHYFRERVVVAATLTPATVDHLADSIRYFLDKGVQTIQVYPTITNSETWRYEDIERLDREFSRIFDACLDHFHARGEVPLALFRRSAERAGQRPEQISMCGVQTGRTPAVDVDGNVYGCATFARSYQRFDTPMLQSQLPMLDLGRPDSAGFETRYRDFAAAVEGIEMFNNHQDKYSSYRRCGECEFLASCGVCPMSIGHLQGNQDPHRIPDFLCAFNLVANEYKRRFPLPGKPTIPPGVPLSAASRRVMQAVNALNGGASGKR